MIITANQLKRLIRRHLLEFGDPGFGDYMPGEDDTTIADKYTGGKINANDVDTVSDIMSSGKSISRPLIDIGQLGFKMVTPEARHLELIHASHIPNMNITPLAGRVTRQSRKQKPLAGFYTYPKFQEALGNTLEGTVNRAKQYVSDTAIRNPEIDTAYIYKLTIDPAANFVEQINPDGMGLPRIPVGKAKEYYDAGIDIIITKSAGYEEVIILNKDVILSKVMSAESLF